MWQVARATLIRNQISNQRAYPWAFSFGYIIGGIYLILVPFFAYHYLIHGQLQARFSQYAGTDDYMDFAIVGGLLNGVAISMMMNVSRALITEWREGTLEALLLSPARRSGYFLGTTVQQFYRILFELVPVLVIGICLGLHIPTVHVAAVLVYGVLYLISCFSIALVLGSVMLYTRDTYIVQNTLFAVLTLLCGFQFPREYLPRAVQWLGQLFPLTGGLTLFRASLLSHTGLTGHLGYLVWVLLLSAVYILLGAWLTRRAEKALFERHLA